MTPFEIILDVLQLARVADLGTIEGWDSSDGFSGTDFSMTRSGITFAYTCSIPPYGEEDDYCESNKIRLIVGGDTVYLMDDIDSDTNMEINGPWFDDLPEVLEDIRMEAESVFLRRREQQRADDITTAAEQERRDAEAQQRRIARYEADKMKKEEV